MTTSKPRRRRGIVLTFEGEQRLLEAIAHVESEENFGQKLTLEELGDRTGLDPGTVAKVLDCDQRVDRRTCKRFFRAFGLELEESDVCKPEMRQAFPENKLDSYINLTSTHIDWGEAVDASIFYGRTQELVTLKQWIQTEQCRLVALLGMGGIGKTALSVRLSEDIQDEFDYLIWRSLREAPPIEKILSDLIKFLSNQQEIVLSETVGDSITRLIHYLRESRCLVILDNAESIFQGGSQAGQYRDGYEGYGTLIQRLGESKHQSCLVITSREKPREVARLEGPKRLVRSIPLQGLEEIAGKEFLKAEGLDNTDAEWRQILTYYGGNPLALRIAANTIQDLFRGNISEFLQQGVGIFGDIRDLLEQQFERLSKMGQSVMYWLAINREPTSIEELKEDILGSISFQQLIEILGSLRKRSLIEYNENCFTLQNVVMEYVTEHFVSRIVKELKTHTFSLFCSHVLIKATAKDYVRETQIRLILEPLGNQIQEREQQILIYLDTIRSEPEYCLSYAAGNLLNLLCHMQSEVYRLDFSALVLRQAYLKNMKVREVDLSRCHFLKCSLSDKFGITQSVIFSPDGRILAASNSDGNIQLWSIETWQKLATLEGHTDWNRSIAFSPDGCLLVSGSEDATIRLWDVKTHKCLHVFRGHTNRIWSVAFSLNGQFIASGSSDATVRVWDIIQLQCIHVFSVHTDRVWAVKFSPDGYYLASGGEDSIIKIWNISQRRCDYELLGHKKRVLSLAFSNDGRMLASASEDCTIRLWSFQKRKCLHIFEGHSNFIRSVAFSPDGRFLASSSGDCSVRLWSIEQLQCIHIFMGHTNEVRAVSFSPDGKLLASGSGDATIRLWDVQQRKCMHIFEGYVDWIWSIAFTPNGRILASGCGDANVRLWDLQTLSNVYLFTGHTYWVSCVAISSDGLLLASTGKDLTIRLWDINRRQCIHIFSGHTSDILSISFSPNGKYFASSSEDSTIRIWDIAQLQCAHIFAAHTDWVRAIDFSPDGKFLASGSTDRTVRLWDIENYQLVNEFLDHKKEVFSVAFSSDGNLLASSSGDTTIRVWDIRQNKCIQILEGHINEVRAITFSPNGEFIASGSVDSTVRLWNVKQKQCIQIFTGHTDLVRAVVFSPDGKILCSGSNDGTIRLWDIPTGEHLAVLRESRPYEGTDITGAKGLTESQKKSMMALGAIDNACEAIP